MVKRYYDAGKEVIKFLNSLRNLVKSKGIRTPEQAYEFAKNQFGKIPALLKKQIDDIFKKKDVAKTEKKGDVVPIKKDEGIKSTQEYRDMVEELRNSEIGNTYAGEDLEKAALDMLKARNKLKGTLEAEQALKKRTDDIASGDVTGETGDLMTSIDDSLKSLKKANKELQKTMTKPENIMDEILKGQKVMSEGYKKGNIRTAVRWFMRQEADAGKLKLSKDDYDALQGYASIKEGDPIEIFRRYYGEDALEQIDEIGDVFKRGESFNHYAQLLRENVHPSVLTPKTKGIGKYDPEVLTPQQEDELRKQLFKDQEQKQMLEDFDVDPDRQPNADGGIIGNLHLNRTGYVVGKLVKGYQAGKALLKILKDPKKIRAAIDDIFSSGDYKYDAQMASEALVENNPKDFGGRLYDDLDDKTRSDIYGAVVNVVQRDLAKMLHLKRASKSKTLDVADHGSAMAEWARKNDPEGYAKIQKVVDDANQKLELQRFKTKGKKGHADGGLINILKL